MRASGSEADQRTHASVSCLVDGHRQATRVLRLELLTLVPDLFAAPRRLVATLQYSMKTFVVIAALAAAAQIPSTQAWWDNGHMLVGEVATQLMAKEDVTTINTVLSTWNKEYPNTNSLWGAAIWPDLIKCTSVVSYCQSPTTPSITQISDWHFVDLPLDIAGGKYGGLSSTDLALFNYSLGGFAIETLENSFKTMATTNSTWAVNFIIRNFVHIFGDLHQPLHAVGGLNASEPRLVGGDAGGNAFKFRTPCAFSNLHALWDAAGGVYSENNWSPDPKITPDAKFSSNATALIGLLPLLTDSVSFEAYTTLSYAEFQAAVLTKDKTIRKVVLESYQLADAVMYKGLDLSFDANGYVACPPQWYMDWAAQFSQFRIALAGKRLAVIMTQFAKQIRAKGIDKVAEKIIA